MTGWDLLRRDRRGTEMLRPGRSVRVALVLVATLGMAAPAIAQVFRFEDDAGNLVYTNISPTPAAVLADPEPPPVAAPAAPPASPLRSDRVDLHQPLIRAAAARYGMDPRLVEAVVRVESSGDPRAVSVKGAMGLMQLMPARAAELGVADPFDPEQNLDGGVRHLRDLLQEFRGDVRLALAAYNAGPKAVHRHRGIPPYPETRQYLSLVAAQYQSLSPAPIEEPAPAVPSDEAEPPSPPPTPQVIYTETLADGAVLYTNVPPDPAPVFGR